MQLTDSLVLRTCRKHSTRCHPRNSSVNKITICIHVQWYLHWMFQEQLKTLECQLLDSTAEKARPGHDGKLWESTSTGILTSTMCLHGEDDLNVCRDGWWWLCTSPQPLPQEEIQSLLKDLAAQTSACTKAQVQSMVWEIRCRDVTLWEFTLQKSNIRPKKTRFHVSLHMLNFMRG